MIEKLITLSVRRPGRVIACALLLCAVTWMNFKYLSLDALPEITDPQALIEIVWEAPTERIDREIAGPLAAELERISGIQRVRSISEMGYGFVYALLTEDADPSSVRREISSRLLELSSGWPAGAQVRLGPDASSVGWIYQYALSNPSGRFDLRKLHDLQTRKIAPRLARVAGVAEVATVGGLKRQIQIHVYPTLLARHGMTLGECLSGVKDALADAGGRMAEISGRDFQIRAVAPVRSLDDLEESVIASGKTGNPIRVRDVGFVQIGSDIRRGIADLDGTGEVVGGIVVMRQGENALNVIVRIESAVAEIRSELPEGVELNVVYDRSILVRDALSKMGWTLAEELVAVILVCLVFLMHARSALVPILILPVVCLLPFLMMRIFGVPVHLPVLAGIAIALGEIVDAVLVMVENAHKRLSGESPGCAADAKGQGQDRDPLIDSLVQVGRPLFYSLAIILFSFLPVFLLEAQEGRLFRPLAVAKTFAMIASVVLSITLGPALIAVFLRRAKIKPEEQNPVSRFLRVLYEPTFRWAMRHSRLVVAVNILLLVAFPFWTRLDKSFMPPLEEGAVLYMPSTLAGLPIRDAGWILQKQDRLLKETPEVDRVFGKAGRAETPTDPAPISMIETTITLKPKSDWRPGMTYDRLISELDEKMKFPGWINAWTQPIRGRMDMLATGIRTELGVVLYADDLDLLDSAAASAEKILSGIDGVRNVYAERPTVGYFLDVQFDRRQLLKAGVTAREAAQYLQVTVAGSEVARIYEEETDSEVGGFSDPVTVLFAREFVDEIHKLEEMPVILSGGTTMPLSRLAAVRLKAAPSAIRRDRGRWVTYVHADVIPSKTSRIVKIAEPALSAQLPRGVRPELVGQYQYRERAVEKLMFAVPLVLLIILWLLRRTFGSWKESLILMLSVPAAMAGGIFAQAASGFPTTVAVLVGYIALYAVAVQTGVVMVVYLKESWESSAGRTRKDLEDAVYAGAVQRLRPKLMTVATTLVGFVPILWSEGPGSEMLRHIAVPMMGGMITSTLHVLYLTPILFLWTHRTAAENAPPANVTMLKNDPFYDPGD